MENTMIVALMFVLAIFLVDDFTTTKKPQYVCVQGKLYEKSHDYMIEQDKICLPIQGEKQNAR
jgi:hypothetical protein